MLQRVRLQSHRRTPARVAGVVLLTLALTAAAAGCGGSSPKATTTTVASSSVAATPASSGTTTTTATRYDLQMQQLGTELSAYLSNLSDAEVTASQTNDPGSRDATSLAHLRVELRAVAAKLAKIPAPTRVQLAQALLITGLREYASELAAVIKKLRGGAYPPTALRAILGLKGIRDMNLASKEIIAKGYTILG